MGTERYDRQLDIINSKSLEFEINIIGAGGIGSWVALAIAKMGCSNITVHDFDDVEDHNIASQFYKESQLGMKKLEALKINVLEQTGIEIKTSEGKIAEEVLHKGLVILALDTMKRRVELANIYKDKDLYIIDGRMGGLQLEVYCCHSSRYIDTTCDHKDIKHEACTAKAISFNCLGIASIIANYVRQFANKKIKDGELNFEYNNLSLLKHKYEIIGKI